MRKKFISFAVLVFFCLLLLGDKANSASGVRYNNGLEVTESTYNITTNSVVFKGTYQEEGGGNGKAYITVQYGKDTTMSSGTMPKSFSGGSFSFDVPDLDSGTIYYYRSCGVSDSDPSKTGCSNRLDFQTTGTASGSNTSTGTGSGTSSRSGTSPEGETGSSSFSFGTDNSSTTSYSNDMSFGGKVRLTKIPNVFCEGSGTIFVLQSNLTSGAKAALSETTSSFSSNGESASKITQKVRRVTAAIKALGDSIPFYSTKSEKNPQVGDQIMGKAKKVPDFSICKLQIGPYRIPFPVRKTTDNYNVSGKSKNTSSSSGSGSWTGNTYNYE